jgi:hypothetical protein
MTAGRVNERYARPLFLVTIITGSFLLFLTQPMVARMALPRVGGAPSVWNSAMLVYQLLLLAGYTYAHWLSSLRPRLQVGIHICLLPSPRIRRRLSCRSTSLGDAPAEGQPASGCRGSC